TPTGSAFAGPPRLDHLPQPHTAAPARTRVMTTVMVVLKLPAPRVTVTRENARHAEDTPVAPRSPNPFIDGWRGGKFHKSHYLRVCGSAGCGVYLVIPPAVGFVHCRLPRIIQRDDAGCGAGDGLDQLKPALRAKDAHGIIDPIGDRA